MKRILFTLLALLCFVSLHAEMITPAYEVTKSEEEFDVLYYVYPCFYRLSAEQKELYDIDATEAYVLQEDGSYGEIRYTLYTQTRESEDIRTDAAYQILTLLMNVCENPPRLSAFNDEDVKAEFNGDFGYTCTTAVLDSSSPTGYRIMEIDFFVKEGQGLVMRTMMSPYTTFFGIQADGSIDYSALSYKYYHSFCFID